MEEEEEVEKDPYEDVQDLPASEENLSRRAARDMWLVALPEVCPDLPPLKEEKSTSKNKFFKTLKQKKEHPIMPFIPEVSDFCVSCDKSRLTNVLKSVESHYETEEHVESQLLALRTVPTAVSKEVPPKNLKESGASESNIRLDPKTRVGTQERLSLESARFSHAYVRICNNFQLALASMESQLEKCKLQADLLGSKSFTNESDKFKVQEAVEDMISNFNIMSLAVKDLNTANGDFLQVAAQQYRSSAQGRADAWIEAMALPRGVKKELGKFKLDEPSTGPSSTPLKVVSSQAESLISSFVEDRKDKNERAVLLKSLRVQTGRGGRGRARGRGQPRHRSPLQAQYQRYQEFARPQPSWGSARGRGNNRGANRGNQRGGRARGRGQNQPFSSAQNQSNNQ